MALDRLEDLRMTLDFYRTPVAMSDAAASALFNGLPDDPARWPASSRAC